MKIVAIAARKGGVGKTLLATHLSVAGILDGRRVAVIDLDPQVSASEWSDGRGDDPPDVISTQPARLSKVLDGMRGAYDLVFIDTPPTTGEADRLAIGAADLVLVPTRIQTSDIKAVLSSIDKATGQSKPTFVIFNDESPQRRKSVADETRRLLRAKGIEVAPIVIHSRIAFGESQDVSRTVLETDPISTAADEMRALYQWIIQLVDDKTDKPENQKTEI